MPNAMKRWAAWWIVSFSCFAILPLTIYSADEPSFSIEMSLEADPSSVKPGDQIVVTIFGESTLPIAGFDLTVQFDSSSLTWINTQLHPSFGTPADTYFTYQQSSDAVRLLAAKLGTNDQQKQGTVAWAELTFQVESVSGGLEITIDPKSVVTDGSDTLFSLGTVAPLKLKGSADGDSDGSSGGSADDTGDPDQGESGKPGGSDHTGLPGDSNNPSNPMNPSTPDSPGTPGNPGNSGHPGDHEAPGNSGNPGNSENPGSDETPGNPDQTGSSNVPSAPGSDLPISEQPDESEPSAETGTDAGQPSDAYSESAESESDADSSDDSDQFTVVTLLPESHAQEEIDEHAAVTRFTLDAKALDHQAPVFPGEQLTVRLQEAGDHFQLDISAVTEFIHHRAGRDIEIVTDTYTYHLPAELFNDPRWAAVDHVTLIVRPVSSAVRKQIEQSAGREGIELAVEPVDFQLQAQLDGEKVSLNTASVPIKRSMRISEAKENMTGAWYDEQTQQFNYVPSWIENDTDGPRIVWMRPGNSIYTVIRYEKTFSDLGQHWAGDAVHSLASKRLIFGKTESDFHPNAPITRAEMAALLVRFLGLSGEINANHSAVSFSDVPGTAWYADVVSAAANAGIVRGFEDGTFRPNQQITRTELAVMLTRVTTYLEDQVTFEIDADAPSLDSFADAEQIPTWGRTAIQTALNYRFMSGLTSETIGPNENATRAQAAVMLHQLLNQTGWNTIKHE